MFKQLTNRRPAQRSGLSMLLVLLWLCPLVTGAHATDLTSSDRFSAFPVAESLFPSCTTIYLGDVSEKIKHNFEGKGHIMYTEQVAHMRWEEYTGNSPHLVAVTFQKGMWWYSDDNYSLGQRPFTPRPSDRLVAAVDYFTGDIDHYEGVNTYVDGIAAGYYSGNLYLDESSDKYSISGSEICVEEKEPKKDPGKIAIYLGDKKKGARTERKYGTGYIMYSDISVHNRFDTFHPWHGAHVLVVGYEDGLWKYFEDSPEGIPFMPLPGDRILAEVDLSSGTVTSLLTDVDDVIHGITAGYTSEGSDLYIHDKGAMGSDNYFFVDGFEICVKGEEPNEEDRTYISLGKVGDKGYQWFDAIEEGKGHIMYTEEMTHMRFENYEGNSQHLVPVTFQEGMWWYYDETTTLKRRPFTPRESDRLVARVDYGNQTVMPLKGVNSYIDGIAAGFASGDFYIQWKDDERIFTVGTEICIEKKDDKKDPGKIAIYLGDKKKGARTEKKSGKGYIMYTESSVHNRFDTFHPWHGAHVMVVGYEDGWWKYYEESEDGTAFMPRPGDRILAEVDFATHEVTLLADVDDEIYGIAAGYTSEGSDLYIFPKATMGSENYFFVDGYEICVKGEEPSKNNGTVLSLGDLSDKKYYAYMDTELEGKGHIMYTEQPTHMRFDGFEGTAPHLVPVIFYEGEWYYYNDAKSGDRELFTPRDTDRLVATVDYDGKTVFPLKGVNTYVQGIATGYTSGDLLLTWKDDDRIYMTGTEICVEEKDEKKDPGKLPLYLGDIKKGVKTIKKSGTGYIMYTETPVQNRFDNDDFHAWQAAHFMVVGYDNGKWEYYEEESSGTTFTPQPGDRLLAEVDLSSGGKPTLLVDVDEVIHGIVAGYTTEGSDLYIFPKGVKGHSNYYYIGGYEICIKDEGHEDPDPDSDKGETIALGDVNLGIAAHDQREGQGFILYSQESVHTRFAETPPSAWNADHLIAAVYEDGEWKVDRNKYHLVPFTPLDTDCIVAIVDFSANTVTMLEGEASVIEGINAGYATGDLVVTPEMWGGVANAGEFGVEGTYIAAAAEYSLSSAFQNTFSVNVDNEETPAEFALQGNYPNPFNPVTTISFSMPEAANVQLAVYDMLGRQVSLLVDGNLNAGQHEYQFSAGDLPSGTYMYRLTTPTGSFVKQMILLK